MGWTMEPTGPDALPVGDGILSSHSETHRRATDVEDHSHMRMSNGVRARVAVLWVWGSALAGAAALLLAWAMTENYSSMSRRIDDQKAGLHSVVNTVQEHDRSLATVIANQQYLIEQQHRIEEKLDILVRRR